MDIFGYKIGYMVRSCKMGLVHG